MRRVVITSGGTREKIDDFRLITNISTGKLGSMFVEYFFRKGWEIDFVHTKYSKQPEIEGPKWSDADFLCSDYKDSIINYHEVQSAQDAMEKLEKLIPEADVVIHAMAVADFGFKKDSNIKLKSDDPEALIEYMRNKIIVNPKIISHFREWNKDNNFFIVSFKFEIDKTREELCNIALNSLTRNKCNLVVANDKAEMMRENNHIGYIVETDGGNYRCEGKGEIVKRVYNHIFYHFQDREGKI